MVKTDNTEILELIKKIANSGLLKKDKKITLNLFVLIETKSAFLKEYQKIGGRKRNSAIGQMVKLYFDLANKKQTRSIVKGETNLIKSYTGYN